MFLEIEKKLKSTIETIIFLGRQYISFRGYSLGQIFSQLEKNKRI